MACICHTTIRTTPALETAVARRWDRRQERGAAALGLPYQQTSYSDAAGTTVVNQIQDNYNGYGQLIAQYQAVSGAVNTINTPVTQYTYSQPTGANYSRLSSMTYPNGRVLDYVYNSGLDSDISRVSALADDSGSGAGNLQGYAYLGLSTIVQQLDANGVALSYIQQPGDTLSSSDGGDQYTGLDRFGRVIDQNYVNTSTGVSTDRFQFAYDRDSNALYEKNLLDSSFSELFHSNSAASGDDSTAYDALNRLAAFERGTLSASGNNGTTLDTVSTPTGFFSTQSWNYDSLGNITSDTGSRYGSETRTANAQNELTDVNGIVNLTPTHDSNGNMTGDGIGNTYIYDAWNRPVKVVESFSVMYTYSYMANSNMSSSEDFSSFITTDFYYSADGHELEDRQGRTVTAQYVWGLGSANDLVLRDDNSISGSLGSSGSGLGERIFVQHDVNSNATALTDTSGNLLERFVYAPYGMSTVYSASYGSASEVYNWVYTFQMGRVEKYLGIKFGARDYDPMLQVWMEPDPAQYVNGLDRYQLDLSNPVSYADPSGLKVTFKGGALTFVPGMGFQAKIVYAKDDCGNHAWLFLPSARAGWGGGLSYQGGATSGDLPTYVNSTLWSISFGVAPVSINFGGRLGSSGAPSMPGGGGGGLGILRKLGWGGRFGGSAGIGQPVVLSGDLSHKCCPPTTQPPRAPILDDRWMHYMQGVAP